MLHKKVEFIKFNFINKNENDKILTEEFLSLKDKKTKGNIVVNNLVSLITNAFQAPMIKPIEVKSDNPFATAEKSNFSFNGSAFSANKNYGKNMPVQGGYFAGICKAA